MSKIQFTGIHTRGRGAASKSYSQIMVVLGSADGRLFRVDCFPPGKSFHRLWYTSVGRSVGRVGGGMKAGVSVKANPNIRIGEKS